MINEIQEKFNRVIEWSQGFCPNTNQLFADWEKNKAWFKEQFQEQLIINCGEVAFNLDESEKNGRVSEFLDYLDYEYNLYDLSSYLDEQKEGFYSNTVVKEYKYGDQVIPVGMKLLRSFKYFIPNKILLEDIQNQASMLIQDDKVHGELCFSIHPLDYLSVSETTYKWRSCHALDGEYRAGNLSYMADACTIVCYLKGSDDAKLPHFPSDVPWNSKKWRCLLFFSESHNEIFFGRQYPMFSDEAMYVMLNTLRKCAIIPTGWSMPCDLSVSYLQDKKGAYRGLNHRYYPVRGSLYSLTSMVKDQSDLHFNDILKSSCYNPYISYRETMYGKPKMDKPKFYVGAEVMCLDCGRELIRNGDQGSMRCACCNPDEWDHHYTCDYCGAVYHEDDMYFINGLAVCPDCIDTHTAECVHCGSLHLKSNSVYDDDGNRYCCEDCRTYHLNPPQTSNVTDWLREAVAEGTLPF